MPREISVAQGSPLVCGAHCLSSGLEPTSSYNLRVVGSIPLGFLISVLAPLIASGEFPQEPICGWSHYAHMAVLIMRADILGVSPCQMCLA